MRFSIKLTSILIFVVVAFVAMLAGIAGKQVVRAGSRSSIQNPEAKLAATLVKASEWANRRGAVMIDDDTRLDKTVAGPGAVLTYLYSFPKRSSREISQDAIHAKVQPEVTNIVCRDQDNAPWLDDGITFVYAYRGNDGTEVARFSVSKVDCALVGK